LLDTKKTDEDGENDNMNTKTMGSSLMRGPQVTAYPDRLLLLNLRGNQLTDLSCKLLSSLVSKSTNLRMLDMRENYISTSGTKILFDAVRKNTSVLYVTQRQNGFMIEGHREILGNTKGAKLNTDDENEDFERIAGNPKHPLRIDIRNNNADQSVIAGLYDTIDYKHMSKGQDTPRSAKLEDYNEVPSSKYSSVGIIKVLRPSSASSPKRNIKKDVKRPASAFSGRKGHGSDYDSDGENMNVSMGKKLTMRNSRDELDDNFLDGGIVNMIEGNKDINSPMPPKGGITAGTTGIALVGSMLDEQIRQMQQSPTSTFKKTLTIKTESPAKRSSTKSSQMLDAPEEKHRSVKEKILIKTKAVYNNRMRFPGDGLDADEHGDLLKRTMNDTEKIKNSTSKTRPSSATSIREKVKEREFSPATKPVKSNAKGAKSLLESLQKLNPAVLF